MDQEPLQLRLLQEFFLVMHEMATVLDNALENLWFDLVMEAARAYTSSVMQTDVNTSSAAAESMEQDSDSSKTNQTSSTMADEKLSEGQESSAKKITRTELPREELPREGAEDNDFVVMDGVIIID